MANILKGSSLVDHSSFAPKFHIQLSKAIFIPGDVVKGNLILQTTCALRLCSIRVDLEGKGQSSFEDEEKYHNTKHTFTHVYTRCRRSVWGTVHKTPEVQPHGPNIIYGPPWSPDEGVLHIPVSQETTHIVVRVMCDTYWPDYVVGEVSLGIEINLDQGILEVPLEKNSSSISGNGVLKFSLASKKTVHLLSQASCQTLSKSKEIVQLKIYQVQNLETSTEKSYFHVQAYAAQIEGVGISIAAPKCRILFPCNMVIPFEFQLPADLPSSFVQDENNWISYSINAVLDQSITKPGICVARCVVYFTVVQPLPTASMLSPTKTSAQYPLHEESSMLPLLCSFELPWEIGRHLGNLVLRVKLDQSGFAPGEIIVCQVKVHSSWPEIKSHLKDGKVELIQHSITRDSHGCSNESFSVKAIEYFVPCSEEDVCVSLQVPSLPPTYTGGLEHDSVWFEEVSKLANDLKINSDAPIIWGYFLGTGVNVTHRSLTGSKERSYKVLTPLMISSIGKELLPQLIYDSQDTMMQEKSCPAIVREKNMMVPPDWKLFPEVQSAISSLKQCSTAPAHGFGAGLFTYRPSYFVNLSSSESAETIF